MVSGSAVAGSRNRGGDSREPLFVFAVLLIGFSILAAALFLLGWSIEKGRKLPPVEARMENWLTLVLALLVIAPAARSAWIGIFSGDDRPSWDRGCFDRISQGLGFALGSLAVLAVGLLIDAVVFLIAELEPKPAILLVATTAIVGLTSAWAILRATAGREAARGALTSRRVQLTRLSTLGQAGGRWQTIEVSTIGRLDRPLALRATVYLTNRGMFWPVEDASALVRFHDWAANHLLSPTPAVHRQRLVIANLTVRVDRHLDVKEWSGRRAQWLELLRMNRVSRPAPSDSASPERLAGLVHVHFEQLATAGLRMAIVEPTAR